MIKVAVLDDVREDLERARGLAEAFAKSAALPMSVRAFENPFDLLDHKEQYDKPKSLNRIDNQDQKSADKQPHKSSKYWN